MGKLGYHDRVAVVWLALVACALFGFAGFAVFAPWSTAVMSVADARLACPGAIDPAWPAVFCNHSHPQRWALGLIQDHPLRYWASFVQMVVGWGAFFWGIPHLRRMQNAADSD